MSGRHGPDPNKSCATLSPITLSCFSSPKRRETDVHWSFTTGLCLSRWLEVAGWVAAEKVASWACWGLCSSLPFDKTTTFCIWNQRERKAVLIKGLEGPWLGERGRLRRWVQVTLLQRPLAGTCRAWVLWILPEETPWGQVHSLPLGDVKCTLVYRRVRYVPQRKILFYLTHNHPDLMAAVLLLWIKCCVSKCKRMVKALGITVLQNTLKFAVSEQLLT